MNTPTGAPPFDPVDFGGGGGNNNGSPAIATIGGKILIMYYSIKYILSQCSARIVCGFF